MTKDRLEAADLNALPRCTARSPLNSRCCSMGLNHFGPHKIKDSTGKTVEEFITKCTSCNMSPNRNAKGDTWDEFKDFCSLHWPEEATEFTVAVEDLKAFLDRTAMADNIRGSLWEDINNPTEPGLITYLIM